MYSVTKNIHRSLKNVEIRDNGITATYQTVNIFTRNTFSGYNFNLDIKAIFSGSLEWPLYTGLTVSLITNP
jgi:hypothetical protein